jgi:hypothetical protein
MVGEQMNHSPIASNVNKIFLGSMIWGAFYLYVFFDESSWNNTLFGQLFTNSYSIFMVYAIQIVFFLLLNFNLFHYTIGKKYNVFGMDQFFKVFIYTGLIVLIVQFVAIFFNIPSHFGLLGYFFGSSQLSHTFVNQSVWIYFLYLTASILMSIYIAGVLVYIYQIKKMNFTFPFSLTLRISVALFVYGLVIASNPLGFDWYQLGFSTLYILFGLLVYIKSKYSLNAFILSMIILFLL